MADTQSAHKVPYAPTPFSTWLGVVCLFVLFGLIVLAIIGPSPRTSDYEQTRAQKRMERLNKLREENEKDLTTYAWVDKNKGVARIPIDRAMELTVAELAQKKPLPAGPIATPPAQTTPAAPAGSANSGAAQPARGSSPGASPAAQASAPPSTAAQQSPAAASATPGSTP